MGTKRSKPVIIGLCGPEGVGKTTIAQLLQDRFEKGSYIMHLSQPLKDMAWVVDPEPSSFVTQESKQRTIFPDSDVTWREWFERVGTTLRYLDIDYFAKLFVERMPQAEIITIDDVRFTNEIDFLKRTFGKCLFIGLGRVDQYSAKIDIWKKASHVQRAAFDTAERLSLDTSLRLPTGRKYLEIAATLIYELYFDTVNSNRRESTSG